MVSKESKYWIVIDHPQQFLLSLYLTTFLKKKLNKKANLLISKHVYWKYFDFSKYRKHFSKIIWFKRYDFPPPRMSIIKQVIAALLLIPGIIYSKISLILLNIDKSDFIIGLSNCQFLENLSITTFPNSKNLAILPYREYLYAKTRPNPKEFKNGFVVKMVYAIQKILKMKPTIFVYRNVKKLGDGDYYLGYKDSLSNVYNNLLIMAYPGEVEQTISLNNNFALVPYPILMKKKSHHTKKKKIIYLGLDFLRGGNMDKKLIIKETNRCLSYIHKFYSGEYSLIYKTHPRETNENKLLNLKDFIVVNDKRPAEIFFWEEQEKIKSVFSICSSASLSAFNAGIDSYLFFKALPFDSIRAKDYEKMYGDMPKSSFIKNLYVRPQKIRFPSHRNSDFDRKLKKIIFS